MSAKVGIVVLNWRNAIDTIECISSILLSDYYNYFIVLVDNASKDGSVEVVTSSFPNVQCIENSANLGYAEGNNVGIRAALEKGAEYVLVINNDTTVSSDALSQLVSYIENHPSTAAVAPKTMFYHDPSQIYFAGGTIDNFANVGHLGVLEHDSGQYDTFAETDWLTGCAILFRSDSLGDVGLFSSDYFLLFEDADWSFRARRAGYKIAVVQLAKIYHKVSATFGSLWSPLYLYYYTRNRLLFVMKNFPLHLTPFLIIGALLSTKREYNRQSSDRHKRAILLGLTDFFRKRFGPASVSTDEL